MSFKIEKQGLSGYLFHYLNTFEQWEEVGSELSDTSAIKKCEEIAKREPGIYRVRNFYNGKILFEIKC